MTFVIDKSPQGSAEWIKARAGVITASRAELARKVGGLTKQQAAYVSAIQAGNSEAAALALAGYKKRPSAEGVDKALAGLPVGDWSDASRAYAFRLAVERIAGEPLDEGWSGNFFSKRGQRLEEEARMLFEARFDCLVEEVGLIYTEDRKFGASADGWVNDDAGVEIKAFVDPSKIMPMLLDGDFAAIRPQVLMNLWLSGRSRWHQVLYVPALAVIGRDLTVLTVDRSEPGVEEEIESLEADLLALDALVSHYQDKLLASAPVSDAPIGVPAIVSADVLREIRAEPESPAPRATTLLFVAPDSLTTIF